MGSIRIEVAGGVVGSAKGRTFTVSDADVNRLVAWARARWTKQSIGAQPAIPSIAEALTLWAQSVVDHTRDAVLNYERAEAAKTVEPPAFTAS